MIINNNLKGTIMNREIISTKDAPQAIGAQITRVFDNLTAVANAAGGSLADISKLNIFLTDLSHFPLVNEIMAEYFSEPYPARAAVGVASLPKGSLVEMDAIMTL